MSFINTQGRRARYRLLFRDKAKGQSSWLTPGGDKRVPVCIHFKICSFDYCSCAVKREILTFEFNFFFIIV